MCAGTPMQPLEVAVEVALVVRRYLDDHDPLPTVPVLDERDVRHDPILISLISVLISLISDIWVMCPL